MSDEVGAPKKKLVTIYTDGACVGNPGRGGYGAVLMFGQHRRELAGGFLLTTNNRMEIMAAIVALESLKESCQVALYSDSRYVVDTMSLNWAKKWRANGWFRNQKEQAVNFDLWERMLVLCEKHQVEFHWVKGHAGEPENERCDELAVQAANQKDLAVDSGYKPTSSDHKPKPAGGPPQPTLLELETELYNTASGDSRVKVTYEGQPCRKCGTPVVRKAPKRHEPKRGQSYYYEYYFHCPRCATMYMVDEAKVVLPDTAGKESPRLF